MQTDYLQILLALAFIVGLIFLLSWGARRMVSVRPGDGGTIAVIATRFLGPREKLLLVEVEGTRVLVGVTATGMNPIVTLGAKRSGFAGDLQTAMDTHTTDTQATSGAPS